MKKSDKRLLIRIIIASIAFFTLGLFLGLMIGTAQGISWCVDTGLNFLKAKGITLDVDVESIKNGIANYQDRIDR